MSRIAKQNRGGRMAVRLRALRRRFQAIKHHARRAATLALAGATLVIAPTSHGWAQTGQTAMAPAASVVNRAVGGFRRLNDEGPGLLYYGINAADRGLGYRGGYMTLGGFIPVMEDDLGGFWSADLRGHISEYGGFFSNTGLVRKQFLGGTLLGVGVYWDYDGDVNQYDDDFIVSNNRSYVFSGGYAYNQVGVSGEWLTDWGNLRSNGYIPVGNTAQLMGPFVGNALLCVNGVNAALGGADLEVGAYVPALADWSGMISVGGYAFGNTRYTFLGGDAAVPWFGGVYTRLDMTFRENWDFSLQYNNDSYFDSTGFARLTYRMGGSRRRNVPDQVEQPMMRNEHIVRARQVPEIAVNACNDEPWVIYHVDSSAAPGGNGTVETPFTTLAEAEKAATAAYDVVYVHVGNSLASPYVTPIDGYTFGNEHQYLVGAGSAIALPTVSCGLKTLPSTAAPDLYPVITNPTGAAIVINQPNVTVARLAIVGSEIGITDGSIPGLQPGDAAIVSDVRIKGDRVADQLGIRISQTQGRFYFENMQLEDLGAGGLLVTAVNADVAMVDSTFRGMGDDAIRLAGGNASLEASGIEIVDTAGTGIAVTGTNANLTLQNATIRDTADHGIDVSGTAASADIWTSTISDTVQSGLRVSAGAPGGPPAAARLLAVDTEVRGASVGAEVSGNGNTLDLARSTIVASVTDGVQVNDVNHNLNIFAGTEILESLGNGVNVGGLPGNLSGGHRVRIEESFITNAGINGLNVVNTPFGVYPAETTILRSSVVEVWRSRIRGMNDGYGIYANGLNGQGFPPNAAPTEVLRVWGSRIGGTRLGGILAENSNLDVARDPTVPGRGARTELTNTGLFGIRIQATRTPAQSPPIIPPPAGPSVELFALVQDARITGATNGIEVYASGDDPAGADNFNFINFTALRNQISRGGTNGVGIFLSTVPTALPTPDGLIRANMFNNQPAGTLGLNIQFQAGSNVQVRATNPANLSAINSNAAILGAAFYNPTLIVPLPPERDGLGVLIPPFVPLPPPPDAPPLPLRPILCD